MNEWMTKNNCDIKHQTTFSFYDHKPRSSFCSECWRARLTKVQFLHQLTYICMLYIPWSIDLLSHRTIVPVTWLWLILQRCHYASQGKMYRPWGPLFSPQLAHYHRIPLFLGLFLGASLPRLWSWLSKSCPELSQVICLYRLEESAQLASLAQPMI